MNPNISEAYNNRGSVKIKLGNYDLAIEDYNKSIELNPNCAQAHLNMVLAKQLLANNIENEEEYNKLIKEAYNDFMKGYDLADDKLKEEYKQKIINLAKQNNNEAAIKICNEKNWK